MSAKCQQQTFTQAKLSRVTAPRSFSAAPTHAQMRSSRLAGALARPPTAPLVPQMWALASVRTARPCSIALALFGGHHIDSARYIGHLLAPAFGAFRFFSFMLRDGLGTFKLLSALLTTILVGRHGLASINQGDRECHFTAGGNPISAVMSANVPKMDIGKPATTGRSEKSC